MEKPEEKAEEQEEEIVSTYFGPKESKNAKEILGLASFYKIPHHYGGQLEKENEEIWCDSEGGVIKGFGSIKIHIEEIKKPI